MWKKYWIVGLLACTAGLFGKINSVEAQGKAVVEDEEEVVLPPDSPAVDPVPVEKETDATKVQGPAGEPAGKKTPKNPNGAENSPNKAPSTPAKTVPDDSLTAKSKLARPREEDSAEVVVTGTKTKRLIKETPVRTEVISQRKIEGKGGARNVVGVLENENGVHVEVSCGICNATAISLSGMPARFTLMLVDGLPLYSSLGSTYGLFGIPAALIDKLEIIKGPASALYGTDAIGGIVNIITKKPVKNFNIFDIRYGTGNQLDMNLVSSSIRQNLLGKGTSAGLVIFGSLAHNPKLDRDGDGISETALQERALVGANLYFYPAKDLEFMIRTTMLSAQLQGGGMGSLLDVMDDYDPMTGLGGRSLSETVLTQRSENALSLKYYFSRATLDFSLAHVFHKQDSDYEGEQYLARQHIFLGSLQLHLPLGKYYSLVTGSSYRKERLWENLARSEYDYDNIGVHGEGSLKLGPWEWLHGVRYNYHNKFGSVVTPRTALRFSPTKDLVLRGSLGTGFRAPTTFYEFFHGVHPGGYLIDMQADNPEQSWGVLFSVAWQMHRVLALTMELSQNVVDHAIGLTQNEDGSVITVFNAEEAFRVRSLEGKLEYNLKPLEVQIGGAVVQIDDHAGVMAVAQPNLSFSGSISYRKGPWSMDLNGKVVGPMDLRKVYGVAYNPNRGIETNELLDPETGANQGSLKRARSPWWGLANFRAKYRLVNGIEIYGELENILDYHQSDVEGNLMFPTCCPGGTPGPVNVTYLWGPLKGRTLSIGATLTF